MRVSIIVYSIPGTGEVVHIDFGVTFEQVCHVLCGLRIYLSYYFSASASECIFIRVSD